MRLHNGILGILGLALCAIATPAFADNLLGNLPQANDNDGYFTGQNIIRTVGFTTPSSAYAVESVDIRLSSVNNAQGVLVRLFASNTSGSDSALTEGASPLATFTNPNFTTAAATTWNFNLTTPFVLTSSTRYWIVVSASGQFIWSASDPSITPTSPVGFTFDGYRTSNDSGASYFNAGGSPSFRLNGSAVSVSAPEPATFALVALVVGGVMTRRRWLGK